MIPPTSLGLSYRYYVKAGNPDNFEVIDRGNGPTLEGDGPIPNLDEYYRTAMVEVKKDESRSICRDKLSSLIHPLTGEVVTTSKNPNEMERRLTFAQNDCVRYQGGDKNDEINQFFVDANSILAKNETVKAEIEASDEPENFNVSERWEQ